MTTKENLHDLVERLPDSELETVRQVLEERLAKHDPVLRAFLTAPEDDEPETEDERSAVREAYDAIANGEVIPDEELKRDLGL